MMGIYGGCFCLSRDILHRKTGAGDAIVSVRWIGGRSFEKSAHLLVESRGKMAFLSTIMDIKLRFQPGISCTPFFTEALCLNIGIPRVFGVAVDGISVCLKLKIASGAFMRTRCGIMSPPSVMVPPIT
jgi:hypothetical protein